ncbi:MAG: chemotaxis protein CheW [Massilia sp.]
MPDTTMPETGHAFLNFRLGDEEYGVALTQVQELRSYTTVTRLANAPAHMMGVLNLRGAIVPIVDLRIKFGMGTPTYDHLTVVVILMVGAAQVGVIVDSVADVVTLSPEQFKPVPAMEGEHASYLLGVGAVDERMILLVDMSELLGASAIATASDLAAQPALAV